MNEAGSRTDIDRELDGMRRIDAVVLRGLPVPPEGPPRHSTGRLRYQLRVRVSGVRGAMKRFERRGYIEPGWTLNQDRGATYKLTELGKRVLPAAALAIEAEALDMGDVQAFWWLRGRLRTS